MATPAIIPPVPESEVVEFTPAQQAKLDEIIKKSMGRAASETRQELATEKAKVTKLEADLRQALEDVKTARTPKEVKDAKGEVAELQAKIDEMLNARTATTSELEGLRKQLQDSKADGDKAKAEALNQKKLNKITQAATKEDFVNLNVVMRLTEDNIKWNEAEGKWIVLNDEGQPRMNAAYDPMTVEEFYQDFATKNPYLVKGSVVTGTGQGGSAGTAVSMTGRYKPEEIFGNKSNSKWANDLANKNMPEYKKLKAEAIAKGLIAG